MELRDYQIKAINKMHNGCILCGTVGSGKSITALAYYFLLCGGAILPGELRRMTKPMNLYIITTAMKRDTHEWGFELARFGIGVDPSLSTYDITTVVDSWNNIKKYADVTDAFFIFDEQRVVGYGAWSKTFIKIARRNKWILLSATPGDKWDDYIPVFIANGFYHSKTEFIRRHAVFNRFSKYPKIDHFVEEGRLIHLRDSILIEMDYHSKPKAVHEWIDCSYDISVLRDVTRRRWNIWTNEPMKNASDLCYCLRRVCNEDPSRIVTALELFEDHKRIIIFYNFDYELEILKSAAWGTDVVVAEWNGHKHEELPKSERWVYLVHYAAGSEGWNCITCDTIIFYSQSYSYRSTVQAAGRIDRANTPFKTLYYYHLTSKSGIDIAIKRALDRKKKFNEKDYVGTW